MSRAQWARCRGEQVSCHRELRGEGLRITRTDIEDLAKMLLPHITEHIVAMAVWETDNLSPMVIGPEQSPNGRISGRRTVPRRLSCEVALQDPATLGSNSTPWRPPADRPPRPRHRPPRCICLGTQIPLTGTLGRVGCSTFERGCGYIHDIAPRTCCGSHSR